ncbi:MAG: F0F1 ATP synthase subunit A [Armatimonadota bacterium]
MSPEVHLTPDAIVLFQVGPVAVTATIVFTWVLMALMVVGSWLVTRRITSDVDIGSAQNLLEVIVTGIRDQIREIGVDRPDHYVTFAGTLFLFIATANILNAVVPGFQAPTGSLSTTVALALCVFVAVPFYGIQRHGLLGYLRQYMRPTPLMLPFQVIGEVSRTLALAIRLFGNTMSGGLIVGLLLAIVPFGAPIVMRLLGLLTGLVQAYIFAVLAMVYIASATRVRHPDAGDQGEAGAAASG